MQVESTVVRLRLAETFVIAREARDWEDVVQVELHHGGARRPRRGGADRALRRDGRVGARVRRGARVARSATTRSRWRRSASGSPRSRASTPPRRRSTRRCTTCRASCSASRSGGCSGCRGAARRPRGRSGSATRTTWPAAPSASASRFKRLKLKLGGGDGLDVERVRAVRSRTDLPLQVDVNEWWSLDEALESIPQLAELGVAYVEQPLPAGDPGAEELRARSPIPIYVDEDCHTLADVARCAEIAHGINIKLAKSGGIREAIRMAHAARALGLGVMLGCMVESGIGIAAGVRRRAALRPRRPRRQPPARRGSVSRRRVRRRRAGAVRGAGSRCRLSGALLILAEGFSGDPHYGKTMRGVLRYRREDVVAILDSTRAGEDERGRADRRRRRGGARRCARPSALVGVATQGGRFPPAWREMLRDCVTHGIGIENGLHEFLRDDPELAPLAARVGRDADRPAPPARPISTCRAGANLEVPGKIVLTVGSDCAIGKMTVSLELDREARARGIASRFVPTGQTGIAIAGWGISVDAVVADFIAGAAERLVVEGSERGGDLLLVEGQGSISHPAYSGVTLGLIHGSAPHAFVLCHMAGRDRGRGLRGLSAAVAAEARGAARARSRSRAGRPPSPASRSTPGISTTTRRGRRSRRRGGDGPRRRRPGPVRRRAPARRRARPRRATLVTQHSTR